MTANRDFRKYAVLLLCLALGACEPTVAEKEGWVCTKAKMVHHTDYTTFPKYYSYHEAYDERVCVEYTKMREIPDTIYEYDGHPDKTAEIRAERGLRP